MDPVRTLLDRELLVSGYVHDLRGALTAVMGYAELDSPSLRVEEGLERVNTLVGSLSDTSVLPSEVAAFRGVAVRVRGPIAILEFALARLPNRGITLVESDGVVVLTVVGVPSAELAPRWSLATVQLWLAEGGPGFAGTRLRIAARIVGHTRYSHSLTGGDTEGTLTIHLARG